MNYAVIYKLSQKISLQCLQHIYMENKVVELCYKKWYAQNWKKKKKKKKNHY